VSGAGSQPVALRDARRPVASPVRLGRAEGGRVVMRLRIVVRAAVGCVLLALWLASAEAAAASAGSIQQIPDPTVKTSDVIVTMSCASATACTAVGSFINRAHTVETLAERWNGSRWSVQRTPKPNGATFSEFVGVSCPSSTTCSAVGDYTNHAGTAVTLAERWNGASWSIQRTANPTGALDSFLAGVSCASATVCTAVGDSTNDASATAPLAERWNGASWSIQRTPKPTGATFSKLVGVSCPSATTCIAVGSFINHAGTSMIVAERWTGTSWSIQRTANPAGAKDSELVDVLCASPTACTALGDYTNHAGTTLPLTERWNGASWSIQAST
jgi:hypothetical protein